MRLYVYIVRYDHGFAPNPFWGYCTLATCKPGIRNGAQQGDWLAGIGSRQTSQAGKLIYAMKVEDACSFDEYWVDPKFKVKRPLLSGSLKLRYGDNIYHRSADDGAWMQEDGTHSREDGSPDEDHVQKDTSVPRVLISQDFVYFGGAAVDIPDRFWSWDGYDLTNKLGRNYLCNIPTDFREAFVKWI